MEADCKRLQSMGERGKKYGTDSSILGDGVVSKRRQKYWRSILRDSALGDSKSPQFLFLFATNLTLTVHGDSPQKKKKKKNQTYVH